MGFFYARTVVSSRHTAVRRPDISRPGPRAETHVSIIAISLTFYSRRGCVQPSVKAGRPLACRESPKAVRAVGPSCGPVWPELSHVKVA